MVVEQPVLPNTPEEFEDLDDNMQMNYQPPPQDDDDEVKHIESLFFSFHFLRLAFTFYTKK